MKFSYILPECGIQILVTDGKLELEGDLQNTQIYKNQKRVLEQEQTWENGDVLLIGSNKVLLYDDCITIVGEEDYQTSLEEVEERSVPFEGYPYFKRSPRIIKRIPTDKLEIKSPPQKATANKASLLQTILPPLGLLAMTFTIGTILGRGIYLLMSVGGTTMTVVIAVIKFFNDRKERKETNKKRQEVYEQYLLDKRKEVYHTYEREKESYRYNYPSFKEIAEMIHNCSSCLYERSNTDEDFLTISIGKQIKNTSFQVTTKVED